VAVKIKLKRLGKIRAPYYRIVVADARTKRDGRAIEEIGKYHPKAEPSFIEVNSERAQHWLSVGAQPTDPVRKILEITGDWQKFKGLPGTEGTLRMAAPKEDRKEIFAAAVQETLGDGATSLKGRAKAKPAEAAKGEAGKADPAAKQTAPAKAEKPARQAKAGDQPEKAKAADSAKADTAKPSDTAKAAKPADGAKAEKPADGAKAEKPADGAKAEKPADGAKAEKPAAVAKAEKPADGAKAEKPAVAAASDPAATADADAGAGDSKSAGAESASEPGSGD
jgi:small subunit ribosomal protein S16